MIDVSDQKLVVLHHPLVATGDGGLEVGGLVHGIDQIIVVGLEIDAVLGRVAKSKGSKMSINNMMPNSKNQNIGMVRIGNCDCRIDSGGNCVDSVISQKSSLKIKKYWTHHERKNVYDVSNFFIVDFQLKSFFNDS